MIDCDNCIHNLVCNREQHLKEECIFFEKNRPHGEWIFDNPTGYWYCSNCEREPKDQDYMLPFCAWCGSDNRKKEGEKE